MGFLDNSGDIILDAVLTDLGRKRLAEGNGTFKVSKFALSDDEIDALIAERVEARKAKDFARADAIRDQLTEARIIVEDGADGATWRRG